MKIRNIIAVALVTTILASCMPVPTIVPTETILPAPTFTPVPTTTPIPETPTEQFVEPQLDREIQIKLGESVTLEGGTLTIKFISLAGDSRCPQGVLCVWRGNAEVILDVSNTEISLNTALEPNERAVGQYTVQLRDVIPYPQAGEQYKSQNYSIKIVVSKK